MFECSVLDDAALVGRLQAAERTIAVAHAEQLAVIAELHTRAPAWMTAPDPIGGGVDPIELTVAEVGLALRMSRVSAQRRTELALRVTSRLPGTLAALSRGEISMAKLRVIDEATEELSSEHAAAVEERVLPRATGQTPAGLGASVARAVIALRKRTVQLFPAADGMATLWLCGPAAQTMAAHRRICELADSARTPNDDRSADARRADTLLDLIMDATVVGHRAVIPDASPGRSGATPPAAAGGRSSRSECHPSGRPGEGPLVGYAPARPEGWSRQRWGSRPTTVHVTVPWTTLAEGG